MLHSQDILKKPKFWAKFDLLTPITKDQKFSKKFHFSKFYDSLTSCQVLEKLNEAFSRYARHRQMYGWMDVMTGPNL